MKKLVTHSGTFHADDIYSYAVLSSIFRHHSLSRTRDPQVIESGDIVFDVGEVYDGSTRFDHHQREFTEKRENGIPYAAFGLVWKKFGVDYCRQISKYVEPEQLQELAGLVDQYFVQNVDASDVGHTLYEGFAYTISAAMGSYNPSWHRAQDFDAQFYRAAFVAREILENEVYRAEGVMEARRMLHEAVEERTQPDLVVLDVFAPWQETVVPHKEIRAIVYPDLSGAWRYQGVPDVIGSFNNRSLLPESWRGIRDDELKKVSGIDDAIFCHPSGFTGGAVSKESAIKMAQLALECSK